MVDRSKYPPGTVLTVSDLIEHGMSLAVECSDCRHLAMLDLGKLNPDRVYLNMRRFTCSQCGSRLASLTVGGRGPGPRV